MAFSISRWLRPETRFCLICGRQAGASTNFRVPPVRHPEARSVLEGLCSTCSASIPWIERHVCRICGRPEFCPDCPRRTERHLIFSRSAVRYDDRMRELLALYKYRGSEKLEPLMGAILSAAYERICRELGAHSARSPFHAVTAVPLARERLEERGFNQAERMASQVAARYGAPYRQLLQRVRHTEKQSLKTRKTRLTDMRGNFEAIVESIGDWKSEVDDNQPARILLVDDVYTTGSTVNECASALQNAFYGLATGSRSRLEIYGLLWARS